MTLRDRLLAFLRHIWSNLAKKRKADQGVVAPEDLLGKGLRRTLTPGEKAMFDALKSTADFWWERFDKRVSQNWKVHLSLWTVLIGYIAAMITGRLSGFSTSHNILNVVVAIGIGVIIFILHYYYIAGSGIAHRVDRLKFHEYEKCYMDIIQFEFSSPEIRKHQENAMRMQASWRHWSHIFLLMITFLLITFAIIVTINSSVLTFHAPAVHENRCVRRLK